MIKDVFKDSCKVCHFLGCREEHHKLGEDWLKVKRCLWCNSILSKTLN